MINRTRCISSLTTVCVLAAFIFTGPGAAQDRPNAQEREDQAIKLLRDACNQLFDAETASVRVRVRHSLESPNIQQQMDTIYHFAYENDNRFSLQIRPQGAIGRSFSSDGETLMVYMPAFDVYATEDAPDNLREFLRKSAKEDENGEFGGHPLVLFGALAEAALNDNDDDNDKNNEIRITRARMADHEAVGEGEPRRLEVTLASSIPEKAAKRMQKMLDRDLETRDVEADLIVWVNQRNPTTFHRIRIEDVRFKDEGVQAMRDTFTRNATQRARVEFTNWQFNDPISADVFEFRPPDTATEVETINERGLLTVIVPHH